MSYRKRGNNKTARAEPIREAEFSLDSKKKVTVNRINDVSLVDIREYYTDKSSGILKPGAKGISLTREVWVALLHKKDEINDALDNMEKKYKKQKIDSNSKEVESKEVESKEADSKDADSNKKETSTDENANADAEEADSKDK